MRPTESSEGLAALRAGIDRCDEELVALLRRRMEISSRVAASKAGTGKPVITGQNAAQLNHVVTRMIDASAGAAGNDGDKPAEHANNTGD